MEATVNGISNVLTAIRRFWFNRNDPTTLGFIRVVTGLMIVYTHLAYSYDLTGFFGKNAWFDLESINRERKEYPHLALPLNGWDERVVSARVPNWPHRKKAFIAWMKDLVQNPSKRDAGLKLLRNLQNAQDGVATQPVLIYVQQLRSDVNDRNGQLDEMVKSNDRNPAAPSKIPFITIPNFLKSLPEKGTISRESFRNDIEQFLKVLPTDSDERQYILNHLIELDIPTREATIAFIENPKTDLEAIDYLDYWSFDKAKAIRYGQPIFSIWFHITDPKEMALAHCIMIGIMVMFTLGLWTRVTSVLTWIAAVSYIHRTQYVLFGMDTMSNILLLYLMIGDSGGAFSLDRLIARYRATRASIKRSGKIDEATVKFLERPPATMSAGLALRLIQVHFCFIYMAAGLSKLKGPSWWNHNAYWDTLANPEFTMIQFQWYESVLRSIASFRPAYAILAAGVIIHTFVAEIGLPFLAWTKARPWIVMIGFLLHAGIGIFMGLTVFSLLMMVLLLSYLPGVAIRGRIFGTATKKTTLIFNPADEIQASAAARAVAFDTDDAIELRADSHATEVNVLDSGSKLVGAEATKIITSKSSILRWSTWLPGVTSLLSKWFSPVK